MRLGGEIHRVGGRSDPSALSLRRTRRSRLGRWKSPYTDNDLPPPRKVAYSSNLALDHAVAPLSPLEGLEFPNLLFEAIFTVWVVCGDGKTYLRCVPGEPAFDLPDDLVIGADCGESLDHLVGYHRGHVIPTSG